jgi:hypothetical protein
MSHKHKHHTNRNNAGRFNKDLEDSDFLKEFQMVMIERLLLNRRNKYHKKNIKRIIMRLTNRNPKSMNTKIKGGFTLSCNVEADFYILLQELLFDMTGEYKPMDDFIHMLLTWFYQYYKSIEDDKINLKNKPFVKLGKNIRNANVNKFNKSFGIYFKNHVKTFKTID